MPPSATAPPRARAQDTSERAVAMRPYLPTSPPCVCRQRALCGLLALVPAAGSISGIRRQLTSPSRLTQPSQGLVAYGAVRFVSFWRPKFRSRLFTINGGRGSHSERSFLFGFHRFTNSSHFATHASFFGRPILRAWAAPRTGADRASSLLRQTAPTAAFDLSRPNQRKSRPLLWIGVTSLLPARPQAGGSIPFGKWPRTMVSRTKWQRGQFCQEDQR